MGPYTTTAKEMLESLDTFFANADEIETRKLWDILSALRGPDDNNMGLKTLTTEVLRGRALPQLLERQYSHGNLPVAMIRSSFVEFQVPEGMKNSPHFVHHAERADRVLREMGK